MSKPRRPNRSVAEIREGFRFGPFALDVHARELRKGDARVRLPGQPFDVLLTLLEQPGHVLTRDDLRRHLWPEGTFVDFEHGLNAAVKRLRAALGDDADQPRFIETLPRRGYRFIALAEKIGGAASETRQAKPRLAVLPFRDVGGPGGHSYFSEGLSEEMIAQLGRLGGGRLAVVARYSTALAQQRALTVSEVSDVLHANYLLEGGVRTDGNRVRITARLVETAGETQVWSESYERDLSDCLLVQAEVASRIAHALALELLPASQTTSVATRHSRAHQAYLQGRYHWNQETLAGLSSAISQYEQALTLDSEFAWAHAALGRAHLKAAEWYVQEPRAALTAARIAATRALALDRTNSEAHLTLAEVFRSLDWEWGQAEESYRLALSFNPSNENAHRLYALFLAARKRPVDAALAASRACELDPLCLVANTGAAWVRYLDGDYVEAVQCCHHTLGMAVDYGPARHILAAALLQMGQVDDAIATLESTLAQADDPVALAWLVHIVGERCGASRAAPLMERLKALAASRYVSAYHLALAYTGVREVDRAMALLHEACDARDPAVMNLATEPRFEPLRSTQSYRNVVARLGLL